MKHNDRVIVSFPGHVADQREGRVLGEYDYVDGRMTSVAVNGLIDLRVRPDMLRRIGGDPANYWFRIRDYLQEHRA